MPRDARRLVCGGTPDNFDIYVTATDPNSEKCVKLPFEMDAAKVLEEPTAEVSKSCCVRSQHEKRRK